MGFMMLWVVVAVSLIAWNIIYKRKNGSLPEKDDDGFTRDYLGRQSTDLRSGSLSNSLGDD
ncbi:MAG: hypothetical protein AWU57_2909 [Marinobacter sp. T13-3]|mgnify:CR=1|jgi:hypothetical protein|nr:MAG: hypothetical protein AWU57_2909 [Marinobacter sp. T13-3]